MTQLYQNGMYALVLAHSRNEEWTAEAATFEVRFPRIILAEQNTHRIFNRNASSSRAIPLKKLIKDIRNDMFVPVYWGKNQSGMKAKEELTGLQLKIAKKLWFLAGYSATLFAQVAEKVGIHKQIANRIIENFGYVTVVFTTTNLSNYIALRDHPDAQPEIKVLAGLVHDAIKRSTPEVLKPGQWHLPYITLDEKTNYPLETQLAISVARCASTSYKTVDGKTMTSERAIALFDKLLGATPIHASPAEHQLTPDVKVLIDYRLHGKRKFITKEEWSQPELHGNTRGFIQYRKQLPNEFIEPKIEGRLF